MHATAVAPVAQDANPYRDLHARSIKANWKLEDVLREGDRFDFTKPFLPEALARTAELACLSRRERLLLNQVRGNGYLCTFGLVEEFILPFVLDHARPHLSEDDWRVRALLQFAGEEAKHIHLFRMFRAEFERGFGHGCGVIGPPQAIADAVLAHDPLAVALLILHVEWMTQRHWTEAAQDDSDLEPKFKSLLRHHWMEEAQHARLDGLVVSALAEGRGPEGILAGVEEYVKLGVMLDGALRRQAELDLDSLQRASGVRLADVTATEVIEAQHQALRWTFIGSGMTHPEFLSALGRLSPAARRRVESLAPQFC